MNGSVIHRIGITAAFAAATIGCHSTDEHPASGGGPICGEAAVCRPVTTRLVGLDESTPLGFTASDALALTAGTHSALLTWAKGGTTALTLEVTPVGDTARFLERQWQALCLEGAAFAECGDVIEFDAAIALATADGSFDEEWSAPIVATAANAADTWHEMPADAVAGSYQVTEVDPAEYDDQELGFGIAFDADGMHGTIDGSATRIQQDVASGVPFPIASF